MSDFSPPNSVSPWRLWRDVRISGIVSFVAGLVMLLFGILAWLPVQRAQTWPTTEGNITASAVRPTEVWGRAGPIVFYAADVRYDYTVNGETLMGSQLGYGADSGLFSDAARALQVVKQYPVGRAVVVHFDPDNPNDALLNIEGTNGGALLISFGAFFIIFGTVILIRFREKPMQL